MSSVQLSGITKSYGKTMAVRGVDLDVADGEFVTLLGASGCGKTTCLRMVAGFIAPSAGSILIGGRDVTRLAPNHRDTGMVFQHYALFPHLTVAENVAFGLKVRRLGSEETRRRVARALDLVRLDGLAERFPAQLSGGQRQRVALARAVVIEPRALLLDEPLSALDSRLREELQAEIKRIQQSLGITTIFVTHDQSEALTLSDRVAVMREGRIEQIDTAASLYRRPATHYVARFVGRMNFIDAIVTARTGKDRYELRPTQGGARSLLAHGRQSQDFQIGDRVVAAVRPERVHPGDTGPNRLAMSVDKVSFLGSRWLVQGRAAGGSIFSVEWPEGSTVPLAGEALQLRCRAEDLLLFSAADAAGGDPKNPARTGVVAAAGILQGEPA